MGDPMGEVERVDDDSPGPALDATATTVVRAIQTARLPLRNEKATQEALSAILGAAGLAAEREVRLAPGDVIDLLLPCGLGIEVKLGGGKRAVLAQLVRYAASPRVRGLVLATNVAMGLPASVGGKPAWRASLGSGWL